jgi:hypothetical protein
VAGDRPIGHAFRFGIRAIFISANQEELMANKDKGKSSPKKAATKGLKEKRLDKKAKKSGGVKKPLDRSTGS